MWKGTLIGFILPLGCHSGCVVEKGGRAGKGDYWMDWIIGSGSLRLCFLVHLVSLDVEDWRAWRTCGCHWRDTLVWKVDMAMYDGCE